VSELAIRLGLDVRERTPDLVDSKADVKSFVLNFAADLKLKNADDPLFELPPSLYDSAPVWNSGHCIFVV
jgi:hypothetical protein